ncbi:MAG: type II toxin-antitoxin system VapC family toxin [Cyanobacteria bacterium J06638_28]
MSSVVVDTHAIVWYITKPDRLSVSASTALEQVTQAGEFVYLSTISLIEIAFLIDKGRLTETVWERLLKALDDTETGVVVMPVDRCIANVLRQIDRTVVPEMPDRIIAATAQMLELPLITRDRYIQNLSSIKTIW